MGRKTKAKVLLSKRNSDRAWKRWKTNSEVMSQSPVLQSDSDTNAIEQDEPVDKKTGFALYSSYNNEIFVDENATKYILVDVNQLSNFVGLFPCPECLSKNSIKMKEPTVKGYANIFTISCNECDYQQIFETSGRIKKNDSTRPPYDINRRMVYAFSAMGKGHRALEVFSMQLNMNAMRINAYNFHRKALIAASKINVQRNLEEARSEVRKSQMILEDVDEAKPLDLTVSYDGSWHKRGFTSKYGVGCCIEMTTGLIIDFEVLSKYCRTCEIMKDKLKDKPEELEAWKVTHKPNCECNYDGSSPMMETIAAEKIWSRSLDYGFRYTNLISDGDSKTLSHLHSLNLYDDKQIEKIECINHVSKRLGTALRKLVKDDSKARQMEKEKRKTQANQDKENTPYSLPLAGKRSGGLKDSTINKLTAYYTNAIQSNIGDVDKMKQAVFATLSHCKSTDVSPQHGKCPTGEESWCFFQKALAKNQPPPSHQEFIKTPLREDVVAKVLPIYQRLGSTALLSRCVDGKTQNANEALHGVLWSKCPKTIFVCKSTLMMRVSEAICMYNNGYLKTVSETQRECGLVVSPGLNTSTIAKRFDAVRLQTAKKRKIMKYQEFKRKKRLAIQKEEERRIQREGVSYGAGEF